MFVFFNLVAYYKMWDRMKELDLRRSDMKYLERTSLMDLGLVTITVMLVSEGYLVLHIIEVGIEKTDLP